eukprot:scaffold735_cov255-Pinguiococcus_pyrenoidosus.AAC.10
MPGKMEQEVSNVSDGQALKGLGHLRTNALDAAHRLVEKGDLRRAGRDLRNRNRDWQPIWVPIVQIRTRRRRAEAVGTTLCQGLPLRGREDAGRRA